MHEASGKRRKVSEVHNLRCRKRIAPTACNKGETPLRSDPDKDQQDIV